MRSELRSCEKVEVDVPNNGPYGLCGRKATLNQSLRLQSSGAVFESRGGRPGLPVLIVPAVSVDIKQH